MKIQRQLTVFLENQPGMMDEICTIMADSDVNIEAFTLFGTVDHGVLRMIVDRPLKALHALGQKGILVIDSDVIEIEAANRPGALQEVTHALSRANVNVDYGYGSSGKRSQGTERVYFQVSDSKKALLVLKNTDVKALGAAKKAAKAAKAKAAKKPKKTARKSKTAKKAKKAKKVSRARKPK